jgi:hypothetical protein
MKNKVSYQAPPACELSTDDRLRLIANVIIDCIQANIQIPAKSEDK